MLYFNGVNTKRLDVKRFLSAETVCDITLVRSYICIFVNKLKHLGTMGMITVQRRSGSKRFVLPLSWPPTAFILWKAGIKRNRVVPMVQTQCYKVSPLQCSKWLCQCTKVYQIFWLMLGLKWLTSDKFDKVDKWQIDHNEISGTLTEPIQPEAITLKGF